MSKTIWALALCMGFAGSAYAQAPADPDDGLKEDIVTAYRILVNEGILDSFGHVTARSNKDPNVFLMPQAMPPALVTKADILEVRVSDSQPIDPKGRRVNGERYIHGEIYKGQSGHSLPFTGRDSFKPHTDEVETCGGTGRLLAAGIADL